MKKFDKNVNRFHIQILTKMKNFLSQIIKKLKISDIKSKKDNYNSYYDNRIFFDEEMMKYAESKIRLFRK